MRRISLPPQLKQLCVLPSENTDLWLTGAADCLEFMRANAASNEVVLFASFPPHGFIHGWLMPHEGLDINQALKAHVRASDAWSVEEDLNAEELYIDPPLSTLMAGCEQFLYRRNFLGSDKGDYTEISQKLVHVMRLHLSGDQRWCRFDENGDLEDVIFVQDNIDIGSSLRASAVIMRVKDLHEYMALTRCALVHRFSFSRFDRGCPIVWDDAVRLNLNSFGVVAAEEMADFRGFREAWAGNWL